MKITCSVITDFGTTYFPAHGYGVDQATEYAKSMHGKLRIVKEHAAKKFFQECIWDF